MFSEARHGRRISPDLLKAQCRYMARTGVQISQTEVQRLSAALQGGASIADAVTIVFEFFARPIDWEAERQEFAKWLDKRSRGECQVKLNIELAARGNTQVSM